MKIYVPTVNMACSVNRIAVVRMAVNVIRRVAPACVQPVGRAMSVPTSALSASLVKNVRSNANASKVVPVIISLANVSARPATWASFAMRSVRSIRTV